MKPPGIKEQSWNGTLEGDFFRLRRAIDTQKLLKVNPSSLSSLLWKIWSPSSLLSSSLSQKGRGYYGSLLISVCAITPISHAGFWNTVDTTCFMSTQTFSPIENYHPLSFQIQQIFDHSWPLKIKILHSIEFLSFMAVKKGTSWEFPEIQLSHYAFQSRWDTLKTLQNLSTGQTDTLLSGFCVWFTLIDLSDLQNANRWWPMNDAI